MIKILRNFFIAEIGPAIITVAFLAFTMFYWGPGIILLGMAFFMVPVAGLGGLVLDLIFRKKSVRTRMLITSSFALMLGIILQSFQFLNSKPNDLKTAILTPQLKDKFNASRGKLQYIGFEHEIYLELPSNPALTLAFLNSRSYVEMEVKENYEFPNGPDWFPHKIRPSFSMYEHTNFEKEERRTIFISRDSSVIYGFYLAY
jgi:hypothetical protein